MTPSFTIAAVAKETGIAKEVLRKWETRYGFPVPVRDEVGNRVYTVAQVDRLRRIKKLLDDGMRPGQVVALHDAALEVLAAAQRQIRTDAANWSNTADNAVRWLRARDPAQLRENLRGELSRHGLAAFAGEVMPVMNERVGEAWDRGDIAVRDEHLYSEVVQGLVREALAPIINPAGRPRILLATVPDEAHTLGILMLESLAAIAGAYGISIGAQAPLEEIVLAALDFNVDIVALSFSIVFAKKRIAPLLKDLRRRLPSHIELWAGGAGTLGLTPTPHGVILMSNLADAVHTLKKWQRSRS